MLAGALFCVLLRLASGEEPLTTTNKSREAPQVDRADADRNRTSLGYNAHREIRIDVFDKYIPAIPVLNGQPINVSMNLQLVMLVDVNEPEEAILLNCWIMVFWYDYALRWNALKYNSSSAEFPSISKLWVPDITWYERIPMVEAYEGDAGIFSGARAVIKSDGEIYISRGLLMKSHCALSVKNFPFDRQECNFTFSSNLHNVDRLFLRAVQNRKESLTDTEGWTMLGFPVASYNKTFKGVGVFTRVVFTLKMKRKPMFYVFYLMLPSFLISALSCLVFVLPAQSSEKVPFCVSILLSLTVFMMIMTGLTPPTEDVPLLSVYFFLVLLLAMLNAAVTIMLENVYDSTGMISCMITRMLIKSSNSKIRQEASSASLMCKTTHRGTASSAQAANLAHYYETEELSENERNHVNSKSNVTQNHHNVEKERLPSKHERPSRRDRINAVEKLNRIFFALSISVALSTPVLFTVYGCSDE